MCDYRATATVDVLRTRADLLRRMRAFFDARGFLEVQTPVLSADTVVDRHLDPIAVTLPDDPCCPGVGRRMWLQTSPEFAMKRLLASGLDAIYQLGPVFRMAERGSNHNPEFTMVEWYRRGDSMLDGMALLSELAGDFFGRPASATSLRDAFQRAAGVDPFACSADRLRNLCVSRGVAIPESVAAEDWDAWFDLLFVDAVQPGLGRETPELIHDYPPSQAALARIREDSPPVAERFELFVDGVELANGYHELLDAQELLRRSQFVNQLRAQDGKPMLPERSRLGRAMEAGLPACAGAALGFDRLVMLQVGANHIDQVLTFPIERA